MTFRIGDCHGFIRCTVEPGEGMGRPQGSDQMESTLQVDFIVPGASPPDCISIWKSVHFSIMSEFTEEAPTVCAA